MNADERIQRAVDAALAEADPLDGADLGFAAAAAAVELALLAGRTEPMPAALRRKVELGAVSHLVRERGWTLRDLERPRRAPRWPWLIAAAALVFAAWVQWTAPRREPPLSLEQQLARLIELDPDVLRMPWTPSEHELGRGVAGEILWSQRLQQGFMRFARLPSNRTGDQVPASQYQLWIVDKTRPQPVDGGVFDVPAGLAELVVPVFAKLPVRDAPGVFVVTKEPTGGVVVSEQKDVVLVAKK
jgi:hypothetical protein